MRAIQQALQSHVPQSTECRMAHDGELRYFESRFNACSTDEVLAIVRDVTERKRLEEQLRQAREELEGKVERQMVRKNPYSLTFRELTVLHLVAAGRSDKEIAVELVVSPQTVHKHVANILAKMDVSSRTAAATRALREGLLA